MPSMIEVTAKMLGWLRGVNLEGHGVKFIIEAPSEEALSRILAAIEKEIAPLSLRQRPPPHSPRDVVMKMNGFDFIVRRPDLRHAWLKPNPEKDVAVDLSQNSEKSL